jgi:hypothetical protein
MLVQFLERLLEQGVRSPRTMRLTALHLTGMWLLYPATITFYIKELKLLTLHGSGTSNCDIYFYPQLFQRIIIY